MHADGRVEALACGGLALGIAAGQTYEEARANLAPGARSSSTPTASSRRARDRELYGVERLDALLAAERGLDRAGAAEAVLDDCRAFAAASSPTTARSSSSSAR